MSRDFHGNYEHYYASRYGYGTSTGINVTKDPRLHWLRTRLPQKATILDIGCHEGTFSCKLASAVKAKTLTGVDIDPDLVEKALERYGKDVFVSARQIRPRLGLFGYFPQHFVDDFGRLTDDKVAEIVKEEKRRVLQSTSMTFRCEDYANTPADGQTYDVVMCLAVTKWVHLHGGDDAVKRLFAKIYAQLKPNGIFVLEAQPWFSYCRRKMLKFFPVESRTALQFRPCDFHDHLMNDIGYVQSETVDLNNTKRTLQVYYKAGDVGDVLPAPKAAEEPVTGDVKRARLADD